MNVNDAVLYIMAFFSYSELSFQPPSTYCIKTQDSKNPHGEVCHLLECPFNILRVFMVNNESIPFRQFIHPYHNVYSPLLFLQE